MNCVNLARLASSFRARAATWSNVKLGPLEAGSAVREAAAGAGLGAVGRRTSVGAVEAGGRGALNCVNLALLVSSFRARAAGWSKVKLGPLESGLAFREEGKTIATSSFPAVEENVWPEPAL